MLRINQRSTWLCLISIFSAALIISCGGDDGNADPPATSGAESNSASEQSGGPVEMVPLSSLDLDLPFELTYDPPVPSDATVSNAIEREATSTTHAGFDLTLNTAATYEDMQAAYDEYVAGFELSQAVPASMAWTGRRAEGEPGLTIAVIGGRLNIAEIKDN